MAIADQLEIFFGEASDAEARVYARLPGAEFAGRRMTGRLLGPECRFAQTLPAAIPFRMLGGSTPEQAPLAAAIVPDPCFWTPELPFLYRAQLEIHDGAAAAPVEKTDRLFGIRRLGCWRQSLYLDAKRWVARGAIREQADVADLPAARATDAVLHVPGADGAFYLEASRAGVPLIVEVPFGGDLKSEISNLARWPAVFMAVVDSATPFDEAMQATARNLLLAARVDDAPSAPAWAKVLICSARALADCAGQWHPPLDRPLIIRSSQSSAQSIAAARAACDRLQREMAQLGDFGGYLC